MGPGNGSRRLLLLRVSPVSPISNWTANTIIEHYCQSFPCSCLAGYPSDMRPSLTDRHKGTEYGVCRTSTVDATSHQNNESLVLISAEVGACSGKALGGELGWISRSFPPNAPPESHDVKCLASQRGAPRRRCANKHLTAASAILKHRPLAPMQRDCLIAPTRYGVTTGQCQHKGYFNSILKHANRSPNL